MTTASALAQAKDLLNHGDVPRACGLLERLASDEPGNAEVVFLLGVCYFRQRLFPQAEMQFLRGLRLAESDAMTHYYLGLSQERQGREEEARKAYADALRIDPSFPEARKKLGADVVDSPYVEPPRPTTPPTDQLAGSGTARPARPTAKTSPRLKAAPARMEESAAAELRNPGQLVYEGHRRIRSFGGMFVLFVLSGALAVWLSATQPSEAVVLAFITAALFILLAIRSAATHYAFYERRIDFRSGLLWRKRVSLWIYQVEDTWLTRSPLNLLTRDAKVHVRASGIEAPTRLGSRKGAGHFTIIGLGNYKRMTDLWAELRDAALVERRGMKNWFV